MEDLVQMTESSSPCIWRAREGQTSGEGLHG